MKTLIDAVNAVNTFRGEVPTISGVLLYMTMELLVTKREFNECVEEMSSNFGTSEAYSDYKASYKMINDDIKPATTTYTGKFGYDDKTVAPPVAVYTKNTESKTCFDLMFFGCQSINAPEAMELLDAIKAGKIHGVTFKGDKS